MNDLLLALRQVRYTNKAFWRNPSLVIFEFVFPLMLLLIFNILFQNSTFHLIDGRIISAPNFYVPSMATYAVITTCYNNIAIDVTFARDTGVLKRIYGTPLPKWAYMFGRIAHATLVAILLVSICVISGALFYKTSIPFQSLDALLLVVLVGSASFAALGLAITTIIPNTSSAAPIVYVTILPLLFFSNIFFPLQNVPAWLNTISGLFPTRHFVEAMISSFTPVSGQPPFLPVDLLWIVGWGLGGCLIALRFFRWQPQR